MEVRAISGIGEIEEGARLGTLLATAADGLGDEHILVISHKAVSKAEGRIVALGSVEAGEEATELGRRLGKDPRLVELILGESRAVLRAERGVLIVETNAGWICANAGIDSSNVPGDERVALLPLDADASARRIRAEVRESTGRTPAVVVSDTFGRAWRVGQTDVAIGCAGLTPLEDWRGREDALGRRLAATAVAIADEVAAAAELVRPKDSGSPAAVVRGLGAYVTPDDGPGAAALRRAEADDLFR